MKHPLCYINKVKCRNTWVIIIDVIAGDERI